MTAFAHSTLLMMIQAAVPGEIARVTDASMDLMMADVQRARVATSDLHGVTERIKAICATAAAFKRELTGPEQAEVDQLSRRHRQLGHYLDHENVIGQLGARSDQLMFGGKHCAETFATLARAIAHLAHNEGGVKFAGVHWCAGTHRLGRAVDKCGLPNLVECYPGRAVGGTHEAA